MKSNIKILISDIRDEFPTLKFNFETNKWELDGSEILRADLITQILNNHTNYTPDDCKLALTSLSDEDRESCKRKFLESKQLAKEKAIEMKVSRLDDWAKGLELDSNGNPRKTSANILVMLDNSKKYGGKIKYNEFTEHTDIEGLYYNSKDGERSYETFIDDIYCDCNDMLEISNRQLVMSTLNRMALDPNRCYHPVKEKIESYTWDGVPRIETLFIDWFKTDDNIYTREVGKKYMLAIIKRIYSPGCKVDHLPIITGATGIGKSEFFKRLGFSKYTTEISASDFDHVSEQLFYQINGSIICTLDELGGMNKRDQNVVKNFFTKTTDKVRLKYAKHLSDVPRHCVFAGSTNDEQFLNDYSVDDERRYWTLTSHLKGDETDKCYIFNNFTEDIVGQLYAEAYCIYQQNPKVSIELSDAAYALFKKDQKKYKSLTTSPEVEILDEALNRGYSTENFLSSDIFVQHCKNYDLHNGSCPINSIPMSYVRALLRDKRLEIGTAKLTKVMEYLGFKKFTNKYYNSQRNTLFIRNIPISQATNPSTKCKNTDVEPLF